MSNVVEIFYNGAESGDYFVVKVDGYVIESGHSPSVRSIDNILRAIGIEPTTHLNLTDDQVNDAAW